MSPESKNPILLPSKHAIVELLVRDVHNRVKHNGTRDTLTTTRERYWILRGRETVKRILRKCVVCKKAEATPFQVQPAPDLPPSRVSEDPSPPPPPPPYERRSRFCWSNGVYILLFTCASTRAVHLELTQSLDVSSFLRAFRRFASRRGLPLLLLSDNGKTFKGACIKRDLQIETSTRSMQLPIEQSYNVEIHRRKSTLVGWVLGAIS